MILKNISGVDPRLIKRHQQLVLEHMNSSEPLSAGLKALPNKISSFASTQAVLWKRICQLGGVLILYNVNYTQMCEPY
jgi:hypothetical protein